MNFCQPVGVAEYVNEVMAPAVATCRKLGMNAGPRRGLCPQGKGTRCRRSRLYSSPVLCRYFFAITSAPVRGHLRQVAWRWASFPRAMLTDIALGSVQGRLPMPMPGRLPAARRSGVGESGSACSVGQIALHVGPFSQGIEFSLVIQGGFGKVDLNGDSRLIGPGNPG